MSSWSHQGFRRNVIWWHGIALTKPPPGPVCKGVSPSKGVQGIVRFRKIELPSSHCQLFQEVSSMKQNGIPNGEGTYIRRQFWVSWPFEQSPILHNHLATFRLHQSPNTNAFEFCPAWPILTISSSSSSRTRAAGRTSFRLRPMDLALSFWIWASRAAMHFGWCTDAVAILPLTFLPFDLSFRCSSDPRLLFRGIIEPQSDLFLKRNVDAIYYERKLFCDNKPKKRFTYIYALSPGFVVHAIF